VADAVDRMRARKRGRLARWLNGEGIEVGALHRPLRVPASARVRYVDRMPVAELRCHYPELAEYSLVPVDIIGSAEDLSALVDNSVDFVIANHLLEHLEYPIRGLLEFFRVLRPSGIVYLALPDQRMGIDHRRPLTSVDHLMDEHYNGAAANRRQHYYDWVVLSEQWCGDIEERVDQLMAMDYSIHFHVWRPDTFLDLLTVTRRTVDLDFEVIAFAPPEYPGDDEFMVLLSKGSCSYPRLPPPIVWPTSYWGRVRTAIAQSPMRPILRPPYIVGRRLARRIMK
jgi:predicted SAM-dependent methyltransferase